MALPETHPKDAQRVAERLQRKVAELPMMEEMPDHRLTVTIGIDEETDLDALINQADQALYAGKQGGRNRVVMSQEAGDEV